MSPYNFGDGAGAIVLRATDAGDGIMGSAMACVGGSVASRIRVISAIASPELTPAAGPPLMSADTNAL